MKKHGALIALILALGFGLLAVVLANKWLSARSSQVAVDTEEKIPSVKVVVAAKDLDVGTPLPPESLALTEWPKSSVPKGAFHELGALKERTVIAKLWAGAPVLASELAAPGSGAGMVATINPGMRAMAVKVDEVSGVGGFILPNTYVDVIAVDDSNRKAKTSKTLLRRVKVLAIAQETFTEEGKPKVVKTVTLELEPKEAEKLALQLHEGSIHMVLRNPLDDTEPEPEKVAVRKVAKRVYVRPPAPPADYKVEVIRRSAKESVNFKGSSVD